MNAILITLIAFVILLLLLLVVRPITILIHELGHAIPALLWTKEVVEVFIGSRGEKEQSFTFKLGRLHFYIKYNLLLHKDGLCTYTWSGERWFLYLCMILLGPLVSLVVGGICFYIALIADFHGAIKVLGFAVFMSACLDFFINIIPNEIPVKLANGRELYNDGMAIIIVINKVLARRKYYQAQADYQAGNYQKAATTFRQLLNTGYTDPIIFRAAIDAYIKASKLPQARVIFTVFKATYAKDSKITFSNFLPHHEVPKRADKI